MTPAELRVAVAKEMGWKRFSTADNGALLGKKRIPEDWQYIPNFGAPDWEATGAIIDEIERRGWGWTREQEGVDNGWVGVGPHGDAPCLTRMKPGVADFHRAVALAFLAACERSGA